MELSDTEKEAVQIIDPQIEESWKTVLKEEFQKDYFKRLRQFVFREKKEHLVYPPGNQIFSAFNFTPFHQVKAVIVGQDPYHGAGQANGLCFSVSPGIRKPPSLQNIFKELQNDLNIPIPESGNLEKWAKNGVFLLNAILTVRANEAASHQNKGWEMFTDAVIRTLSKERTNLVFLLWGKFAQTKEVLIDSSKHLILKAAHPSPLAQGAYFGSKHFSKTNNFLISKGIEPIQWNL